MNIRGLYLKRAADHMVDKPDYRGLTCHIPELLRVIPKAVVKVRRILILSPLKVHFGLVPAVHG